MHLSTPFVLPNLWTTVESNQINTRMLITALANAIAFQTLINHVTNLNAVGTQAHLLQL
jgi:hypothetical protein